MDTRTPGCAPKARFSPGDMRQSRGGEGGKGSRPGPFAQSLLNSIASWLSRYGEALAGWTPRKRYILLLLVLCASTCYLYHPPRDRGLSHISLGAGLPPARQISRYVRVCMYVPGVTAKNEGPVTAFSQRGCPPSTSYQPVTGLPRDKKTSLAHAPVSGSSNNLLATAGFRVRAICQPTTRHHELHLPISFAGPLVHYRHFLKDRFAVHSPFPRRDSVVMVQNRHREPRRAQRLSESSPASPQIHMRYFGRPLPDRHDLSVFVQYSLELLRLVPVLWPPSFSHFRMAYYIQPFWKLWPTRH